MVGRLSDARGRKPFLLLSFLCSGAQAVAMLLYLRCGVSLLWFFPAQVSWPALGPHMKSWRAALLHAGQISWAGTRVKRAQ